MWAVGESEKVMEARRLTERGDGVMGATAMQRCMRWRVAHTTHQEKEGVIEIKKKSSRFFRTEMWGSNRFFVGSDDSDSTKHQHSTRPNSTHCLDQPPISTATAQHQPRHSQSMNGGGERLANYQPTDLSFSPDGACLAYLHAASHQVRAFG